MNENDVETLSDETLYDGFFRMKRYRFRHRLFAGGWSEPIQREVFERDACVAVIPYDAARDRVVLIEQFRPGAMAAGDGAPWVTEIVAGIIEDGETPEQVAIREAEEEAGCAIETLIPITQFYLSPGGSTEYMQLYCGLTDSEGIGGIHGVAGEGEDIRVFTEPLDDALARIATARLRSAFSIVALQWLALHRDQLVA
jgi:ADP-ribose pyrophosphatase